MSIILFYLKNMGTQNREDRTQRMASISPSHSCFPPSQPRLISFSLHPSFSLSSSWSEVLLPQNLTLANFNIKSVCGKNIKNSQVLQQAQRIKQKETHQTVEIARWEEHLPLKSPSLTPKPGMTSYILLQHEQLSGQRREDCRALCPPA